MNPKFRGLCVFFLTAAFETDPSRGCSSLVVDAAGMKRSQTS